MSLGVRLEMSFKGVFDELDEFGVCFLCVLLSLETCVMSLETVLMSLGVRLEQELGDAFDEFGDGFGEFGCEFGTGAWR